MISLVAHDSAKVDLFSLVVGVLVGMIIAYCILTIRRSPDDAQHRADGEQDQARDDQAG